jgi:hypothetical protein
MKGMPRSLARAPKSASVRRMTIPIRNLNVATTDAGAAGAWGTAVLGGMPEGIILILGTVAHLSFTKTTAGITDTFVATVAVGTSPTADGTLNGTEIDILAAAAQSAAVAGVSPVSLAANSTAQMVDNTDKSKEFNLNVTVPDAASSANSALKANGVIHVAYVVMGDD